MSYVVQTDRQTDTLIATLGVTSRGWNEAVCRPIEWSVGRSCAWCVARLESEVDAATTTRRERRRRTRDVCRPLRHWLYGHRDAPYPSRADKLQLAVDTQLTLTQVTRSLASSPTFVRK